MRIAVFAVALVAVACSGSIDETSAPPPPPPPGSPAPSCADLLRGTWAITETRRSVDADAAPRPLCQAYGLDESATVSRRGALSADARSWIETTNGTETTWTVRALERSSAGRCTLELGTTVKSLSNVLGDSPRVDEGTSTRFLSLSADDSLDGLSTVTVTGTGGCVVRYNFAATK